MTLSNTNRTGDKRKTKPMNKPILFFIWTVLISFVFITNAQAATYYFHNDHLGTPQVVTDDSQNVVWQGEYDPFGKATETVATVEQNLRFPGQYLDRETGLHYNYFRTYDPATGRYTQSDPIGLGGGVSTYGYVHQNPLRGIDPLGLVTCVLISKGDLPIPGYDGHKNGSHSTVWASGGGPGSGSWAYDPAGSYGGAARPTTDLFNAAWSRDTGGTYRPGDFYNYASKGRHSLEIVCKDTTPGQEKEMYESAQSRGNGLGTYCAADVSAVLSGKPGFERVKKPFWIVPKFPVTLLEEVRKSPSPIQTPRQ